MATPQSNVLPFEKCTRWPSWRKAARGTGLPSPRNTVARIHMRNEQMTEIILGMLKSSPLDSRDTAIRMGCSQKNINYHLGKLRDRGQAVFDPGIRRWVPSQNGIIRDRAARQIKDLIEDLRPVLNRRTLDRLAAIAKLLKDPMHY